MMNAQEALYGSKQGMTSHLSEQIETAMQRGRTSISNGPYSKSLINATMEIFRARGYEVDVIMGGDYIHISWENAKGEPTLTSVTVGSLTPN